MDSKILTLGPSHRENLDVLYLAYYATDGSEPVEPEIQEDGIAPKYHHELGGVLEEIGLDVTASNSLSRLLSEGGQFDFVFSIYHSGEFANPEVFASAVCEYLGVPYLGARPHIRSLCEDKHLIKVLADRIGVAVPEWKTYRRTENGLSRPSFEGPYIVKPRFGAASIRIDEGAVRDEWPRAKERVRGLLNDGIEVVVEQFVPGRDVTVPVVGAKNGPWTTLPIETVSGNDLNIQTHWEKRHPSQRPGKRVYPDAERAEELKNQALALHPQLQPVDYYRCDFRVNEGSGRVHLLEANICCNLGSHASMVSSARAEGLSQAELVEHILSYSLWRQQVPA
jgi:D-alanine-D-alanine ligase